MNSKAGGVFADEDEIVYARKTFEELSLVVWKLGRVVGSRGIEVEEDFANHIVKFVKKGIILNRGGVDNLRELSIPYKFAEFLKELLFSTFCIGKIENKIQRDNLNCVREKLGKGKRDYRKRAPFKVFSGNRVSNAH